MYMPVYVHARFCAFVCTYACEYDHSMRSTADLSIEAHGSAQGYITIHEYTTHEHTRVVLVPRSCVHVLIYTNMVSCFDLLNPKSFSKGASISQNSQTTCSIWDKSAGWSLVGEIPCLLPNTKSGRSSLRMYVCMCMLIYVCMYVLMCACIYVCFVYMRM
jgi:hypothetical protein